MLIQIIILLAIVACGKYSPNIKTEGGTTHEVTTVTEVKGQVRTVHAIELDVCDSLEDQERKAECIESITKFILAQSEECNTPEITDQDGH